MQKFYYDWEQDAIFFEKQMKIFHEANNEERSRAGEEPFTFAEYIENCLTKNNGCIDIIEAENFNDAVNKIDRMYGILIEK